jgi:hypothetical protein
MYRKNNIVGVTYVIAPMLLIKPLISAEIHTHTHARAHTYTHTHARTHTHTHTQRKIEKKFKMTTHANYE